MQFQTMTFDELNNAIWTQTTTSIELLAISDRLKEIQKTSSSDEYLVDLCQISIDSIRRLIMIRTLCE